MISSFSEIISALGGPAAFGRAVQMTPGAAKQSQRRDSIAPEWWGATIRAAQEAGLEGVTERRLIELAEQKRTGVAA